MAPMRPVSSTIKALFSDALSKAFPAIQQEPLLMKCNNTKYGDYQLNNAMGLYKDHGKVLGFANPAAVANAIKDNVPANNVVHTLTVSPQGFLSFKISDT